MSGEVSWTRAKATESKKGGHEMISPRIRISLMLPRIVSPTGKGQGGNKEQKVRVGLIVYGV